jgi:hypothetical protein
MLNKDRIFISTNKLKLSTMKTLKQKVEDAIKDIVDLQTTPPQIDYISPLKRNKVQKAIDFLESLPEGLSRIYFQRIENQVNQYYSPCIEGIDGGFYSIAELNAMF